MKKSYGGQALIEGVMMRGGNTIAMAVRKNDGQISCEMETATTITNKYPFLKWPFIRGSVNLVESMMMGFKALTYSANESAESEEEELTKGEMTLSVIFAIVMGVGLFFVLPAILAHLTKNYISGVAMQNILEGVIRVGIFVLYILAISRMKEIRRVFQYHGAEHKAIHCYEAGKELTVENCQKFNTLHPRCGTSFMFIVMVISIFVFSVIGIENVWGRILSRVILLPIVAGVSYEFLKFTSRHITNPLVRLMSWPGMKLQTLTTKDPDDDMVEVALVSLKAVMAKEEPDYTADAQMQPVPAGT